MQQPFLMQKRAGKGDAVNSPEILKTYYVDAAGGNDSRTATEAQNIATPWQTLAKACQMVTANRSEIVLRAGTYNSFGSTGLTSFLFSAANGARILIRNHLAEAAIIQLPATTATALLRVTNKPILTFRGVTIRHSATADQTTPAIPITYAAPGTAFEFQNCTIDWRGPSLNVFQFTGLSSESFLVFNSCTINLTAANYNLISIGGAGNVKPLVVKVLNCTWTGGFLMAQGNPFNVVVENCTITPTNTGGVVQFAYNMAVPSPLIKLHVNKNKFMTDATSQILFSCGNALSEQAKLYPGSVSFKNNVIYSTQEPTSPMGALNNIIYNFSGYYQLDDSNYYLPHASAEATTVLAGGRPTKGSLSGVVGCGDSIMYGTAGTAGNRWYEVFNADATLPDATVNNYTAIGGLKSCGLLFEIDRFVMNLSPKYAIVSIGTNNIDGNRSPNAATSEQIAADICVALQRMVNWGVTPIWLGIPSGRGGVQNVSPPDNTFIQAVNVLVERWCRDRGYNYGNILNKMMALSPNTWWKTGVYYDALATDVHPNNAGHAVIAQVAKEAFPV